MSRQHLKYTPAGTKERLFKEICLMGLGFLDSHCLLGPRMSFAHAYISYRLIDQSGKTTSWPKL